MGIESPNLFFAFIPLAAFIALILIVRIRGLHTLLGRLYTNSGSLKSLSHKQLLLLSFVGILIVIALAGLHYVSSEEKETLTNVDAIIVNDDSFSFSAKDGPDGARRIDRSKEIARSLALSLTDANIAVCEFTSVTFCRASFGSPTSLLVQTIDRFEIEAITGSGSEITEALRRLANECPRESRRQCVIFLLSDGGEELTAEYYHRELDRNLQYLNDRNIKVIAIGVGGNEKVQLALRPLFTSQSEYEVIEIEGKWYEIVTTRLLEEKLKHIASATGGVYIHESKFREEEFADVLMSSLEQTGTLRQSTKSLSWIFVGFALLACFVYGLFFLDPPKFRKK